MPRQRHIKPLDRILSAYSRVEMAVKFPESVKTEEELRERLSMAYEVLKMLIDVRNIVATVASLNEEPREAIEFYVTPEPVADNDA